MKKSTGATTASIRPAAGTIAADVLTMWARRDFPIARFWLSQTEVDALLAKGAHLHNITFGRHSEELTIPGLEDRAASFLIERLPGRAMDRTGATFIEVRIALNDDERDAYLAELTSRIGHHAF